MANVIYETDIIAATNADILLGTRLNSIPYNGLLTLDFASDIATVAAHFLLTIQPPDGEVPVDSQIVPGTNPAIAGVLDDRTLLRFTFNARQGGHFNISLVEVGAVVLIWRAVLKP